MGAAVLVAGGIALLAREVTRSPDAPEPSPTTRAEDRVVTTLLFGTREEGGPALWMSLLAYDRDTKRGAVIFVPAHSASEVPGRGLQGVGESLRSGGIPLLLVSTENLLGAGIDRYVELSENDARLLFETIGPLSVHVPEEVRVPAGRDQARLLFAEGPQNLAPQFLVRLLYVRGLDSDDIELGNRHVAFWHGFFEAFEEDPAALGSAMRAARGALAESDAQIGEHVSFFNALAGLDPERRTISTLPVQQVSVGGSELYAVDDAEVKQFMRDTLVSIDAPRSDIRVQVLNGNGVPGIGQEVAERLVGAGFRVVLTGNARRLNYARTLVITYDPSAEGQAIAERARKLLGVGEVQISAQQQGIVDLTIVVGKDFLRTR